MFARRCVPAMVSTSWADVNVIRDGRETTVKYPVSSVAGSTVHSMVDVSKDAVSVMLVSLESTASTVCFS